MSTHPQILGKMDMQHLSPCPFYIISTACQLDYPLSLHMSKGRPNSICSLGLHLFLTVVLQVLERPEHLQTTIRLEVFYTVLHLTTSQQI